MGKDENTTELSTIKRRRVETQYLIPPKDEDIEDSESECENQKKEQTREELTLVAQKAAPLYEQCVIIFEYVTTKMNSLDKDQQCAKREKRP